ncbi:MAG: hypothetical protein M1817_005347 [Caeruleum heppii]|nr:MAG: hypothetical protein M1817_005347 [Caeruleum heppii]
MAYIAPIHKATSVRHALKLRFLDPDEDCLIVAKANQLHIYRDTEKGLISEHVKTIYGKITILQKLRPASSSTDHLFIGTDRSTQFTIYWDQSQRRLCTGQIFSDTASVSGRESQSGEKCLVDPTGQLMALELVEGVVTVIPFVQPPKKGSKREIPNVGKLGIPAPARIAELFIRSAAFLHGSKTPRLALLYEDGHRNVHLRAKEIVYENGSDAEAPVADLSDTKCSIPNLPDRGANYVIPVREPVCGLLIVGESSITYVDDRNNQTKVDTLDEPTIFVAWAALDDLSFILADDYGKLFLLELDVDGQIFISSKVTTLGEISRATVLVPLGNGRVFVGSHQGDSQLIQIESHRRSIQILQTIPNIAPILDFTVMDMGDRTGEGQTNEYSSGQARIVTGSGAFQNGSLRSVRSGVGLEDQGILAEMDGIRELFSVRSSAAIERVDTLVVSFVNETRIFSFTPDGEVEEVEAFKSYVLSENTLVAANTPLDRMIQVTSTSVRLIDSEGGTVISEWHPEGDSRITNASSNDEQVLVVVGGVSLVVLDIRSELNVIAKRIFDNDNQIACVTIPQTSSAICFVGFWQSGAVDIVKLDNLETVHREAITDMDNVSVPRNLLLTQIFDEQPPTLFVAMADGTVVSFTFDVKQSRLSGKKSIVLGTQQANFCAVPRGNGLFNVFATCEHPSLIYGSEGRIVYSAVTADEAICVCPFDSDAYPSSVAIATPDDLRIALVDEERRTHVKDLQLQETVRRVAYSAKLRAFILGTIRRTIDNGVEVVKSHVKLVDEVNFELLATFELNSEELVESVIRAELDDGNGELVERFVVGTGYLDDEQDESIRGRVMIFDVLEDRTLRVLTELSVRGACRCLGIMDGKIVAALIKTVVIYSLNFDSARPDLVKRTSYRTSTAPIDIAVTGNTIAVADLMKSVSIVEYSAGHAGAPDKLTEVARHFQVTWATAVAHVAEDTFLESDAEGNLMVLHQNRHGVTEDDRRRLEVTSEMRLGEMVNRIRRISVPVSSDAVVIPRAFLATVDGSIHLFALVSPKHQDLLMRLQTAISQSVSSLGQIPFSQYRAFRNSVRATEEPFRFVDGELIEGFLSCTEEVQREIVGRLGGSVDVEGVRGVVEGLRRLH